MAIDEEIVALSGLARLFFSEFPFGCDFARFGVEVVVVAHDIKRVDRNRAVSDVDDGNGDRNAGINRWLDLQSTGYGL